LESATPALESETPALESANSGVGVFNCIVAVHQLWRWSHATPILKSGNSKLEFFTIMNGTEEFTTKRTKGSYTNSTACKQADE
jgi:hypothetical protein